VLGLLVGVVGAVLVVELALSSSRYALSIPVGTLIVLLLAGAVAGLLAAQLPARRAAKLDILAALASE
jgi:putative ABC transport system permease protein